MAASEARYRLLADNATDIIATYGIDGVFRYISPAIEGSMGYRPEELIGRPFYEFLHPEDVAHWSRRPSAPTSGPVRMLNRRVLPIAALPRAVGRSGWKLTPS